MPGIIRHYVGTRAEPAPGVEIRDGRVVVGPGKWPGLRGELVEVTPGEVELGDVAYVYVDREGRLVGSAEPRPYGEDGVGGQNEMLDVVAWRDGGDWHVIVLAAEETG